MAIALLIHVHPWVDMVDPGSKREQSGQAPVEPVPDRNEASPPNRCHHGEGASLTILAPLSEWQGSPTRTGISPRVPLQ